jgi:hypothetical protein
MVMPAGYYRAVRTGLSAELSELVRFGRLAGALKTTTIVGCPNPARSRSRGDAPNRVALPAATGVEP